MNLGCLVPFAAALLGGCVSDNTPGDLVLISVQVVDWRDQEELPGPGATPVLGMMNSRDLALMGHSVTGGPKSPRALLKVEFSSATNLPKFAIENTYNLANKTFFCDRVKTSPFMSFPDIFWQGSRLGPHEGDAIGRQPSAAGDLLKYYIFIDVVREKIVPSNPPQEGFDLRKKPEDICFYVGGGNQSGSGYRSNMVKIPKDRITMELQKAPPQEKSGS